MGDNSNSGVPGIWNQVAGQAKGFLEGQVKGMLEHNYENMANSYNFMIQSFADFGNSVKNASLYNSTYIQNGNASAIHSDVIGDALQTIWKENADPEFDNFIKNFDVWGSAMVQVNALSEDYKAAAEAQYNKMNIFQILGAYIGGKTSEMLGAQRGVLGVIFGNGHGYVLDDEINKYMRDNNIRDDSSYNYDVAERFRKNYDASKGAKGYWDAFDQQSDAVKVILTRHNSQKAEEIYRQFPTDRKSTSFFHAIDQLDPGEKEAFEQYAAYMENIKKAKGAEDQLK